MLVIVGAAAVPAAFVAYFYRQELIIDQDIHGRAPFKQMLKSFTIGGLIGVIVAGFLEVQTLRTTSVLGLFGVGVIEESAKLIFPLIIYVRAVYRSEIDGLLFGVASGMGFAALETMGYGILTFIQSQGDLGTLEQVLVIRGLLSPADHAAWTGLVTAVLWHEREKHGKTLSLGVIGAFILAIVLHALWDVAGFSGNGLIAYSGYIIIGAISLILLFSRLRESRQPRTPVA
jgi:RsiW-degrading membrane proteinase PrsW (M82 family)